MSETDCDTQFLTCVGFFFLLLHKKGKPGKAAPKGKQSSPKGKPVGGTRPADSVSSVQVKGPAPIQEPDEGNIDPKYISPKWTIKLAYMFHDAVYHFSTGNFLWMTRLSFCVCPKVVCCKWHCLVTNRVWRHVNSYLLSAVMYSSDEYSAAAASLLRQFRSKFTSLVIPCHVASGKCANPGELPYRFGTFSHLHYSRLGACI